MQVVSADLRLLKPGFQVILRTEEIHTVSAGGSPVFVVADIDMKHMGCQRGDCRNFSGLRFDCNVFFAMAAG